MAEWTEGVCGDGAAILRDGEMIPIEAVVAVLNKYERAIVTVDKYERALRGIISHWNEFGGQITFGDNRDDYGFDERIDAAARLVVVRQVQPRCANCGLPIGMHPVSAELQCAEFVPIAT